MDDAHDDAEVLPCPDGVRAIDARLDADLAEQFVEIVRALLETERERVVLRDDQRAGEVAILQVLVQRVVLIVEAGVQRLGELAHVRAGETSGQRLDGRTDASEGRAVERLAEVDLAVAPDSHDGVEPAQVRIDGILVRLQADDLTTVGIGRALEVILRLERLLLGRHDASGGLDRGEVLEALEIGPVVEDDGAEEQRLVGVGAVGLPFVDQLQQRCVTGRGHRVGLGLVAAGQPATLHVGAAPAIAEVGMHLLGEQEEYLLIHLGGRTEHAFDMRVPVGFGVAVGQVEGVHDLALVARGDAGLAEERHHAGEAVDITLHHHRRDGDARVLGEAIAGAQFLRELGVVRLTPGEEEILGQSDSGGRVSAGQLGDTIRRELEIGADDDRAGEAGVEAGAQVGRQGREPLAGGRQLQQLFGVDLARAVTVVAAAAGAAGLSAERLLDLRHPGFRHQAEDLPPVAAGRVDVLGDEVRQHRLGAEVVDALRGGRAAFVLQLTREAADDLERGVRLGLHQVGERAAEDGRRDLREHAEHLARGPALVPVADLLLRTEDRHVVAPDARDLVALGDLGGLFRREERRDLLPEALVGDLVEVGADRQILPGEVAETAGQQDASGREAAGGILAAELLGPARQALGDPEAFVGRHDLAEHLAELAEFEVGELAGARVGQGEDVLQSDAILRPFGEVGQDLIVDAAAELGRQRGELRADLRPVAEAEGREEAGVGAGAGVRSGRLLHRREDFGELAGITMAEQAFVLLLRLGVERRGLLGGKRRGAREGGAEERTEESHGVFYVKGFRNRCRGSCGLLRRPYGHPSSSACPWAPGPRAARRRPWLSWARVYPKPRPEGRLQGSPACRRRCR